MIRPAEIVRAALDTGLARRVIAPLAPLALPRRHLNVHEFQSMQLMQDYGVPVPFFKNARTAEEAEAAAGEVAKLTGSSDVVVKAQVLAGGRGLGTFKNGFQGGVHIATRPSQAREYAAKMLGEMLVTKQTGEEGRLCENVLMTERMYMRRELYFSIVMDRASSGPVLVASTQGGMNIEDVAESTPDAIIKVPVDIKTGLLEADVDALVEKLLFEGAAADEAKKTITNLYNMFIATDATQLEVNPLAETPDGRVLVCDAKLNFDDNAEFRHPDIFSLRDKSQEDPREVEASLYDLNYIGLSGNIGCMVNGAGLAMATMDIVKLHGGSPANFLDVGGGATEKQVEAAFKILNDDPQVQAILVNIFGGIMRCDVIAQGIVNAARTVGLRTPIVIRLQGTNVDQAKALIDASGYRMFLADDLDVAATTAVKVANICKEAAEISVGVKFELPL